MIRIAPYLSAAEATPDKALKLLDTMPAVARYLLSLSRSNKSRARSRLTAGGYSADVVAILLPKCLPQGSTAVAGVWVDVPARVRTAVADAINCDPVALSECPDDWDAPTIETAANAVRAIPVSRVRVGEHLGRLNVALRLMGVTPDTIGGALALPPVTIDPPEAAPQAPAELPEPYRGGVEALRGRLAAFAASDVAPSPQDAADLITAVASAPGVEPLTMGARGGFPRYVSARLSGTAADGSPLYPMAAAVGVGTVRDALARWRGVDPPHRVAALAALPELLSGLGITRAELSAIGLGVAAL